MTFSKNKVNKSINNEHKSAVVMLSRLFEREQIGLIYDQCHKKLKMNFGRD